MALATRTSAPIISFAVTQPKPQPSSPTASAISDSTLRLGQPHDTTQRVRGHPSFWIAMVAVKTHQAEAFLRTLERLPQAILFYGPDAGLVVERAARLAQRLAAEHDPPGEILRLDDASLEEDPNRL